MRKRGYGAFRLYLPMAMMGEVVKARENLPAGAKPTQRMMEKAVGEAIAAWADVWLRVKRSPM